MNIKNILHSYISRYQTNRYGKYICPVCSNKIIQFNKIPDHLAEIFSTFMHSPFHFETLNLLQYSCPSCGASDRDRLYALYFKKIINSFSKKKFNLLDIAPSQPLQKYLKSLQNIIDYHSADLSSELAEDKIDITDMYMYKNETYDIIICSHVLEHVQDDRKAIKEIYRILKKDGWAIIMVPILLSITRTDECMDFPDENEKIKRFGQSDHIRLYSKQDFIQRLTEAKFSHEQKDISFFGKENFKIYGIHPRSILYIVEK